MPTWLSVKPGNDVGPESSKFHVNAALIFVSDSGSGYNVKPAYSVDVSKGDFSYGGYTTTIESSWGKTFTIASASGNGYGYTEGDQFHLGYGESYTLNDVWAQYVGGKYRSETSLTYTVPRPTHTVSYNANGGSGAPSAQTKTWGYELYISSTVPTRTGYTFQGWATSQNGSVAYQPGDRYFPDEDVTLYAQWQIITYAVAYSANGGSGAPSSQTKIYGQNLTLSSTIPSRTGYSFLRWNTNSDGSGTNYSPGATYTSNAALTLYAIWQINTYTITYNANGGTGAPNSQTKTYGTDLTLSSTEPTRAGYWFLKWNTKSDGSGTNYSSGGNYSANESATLYAVWGAINFILPLNPNGGTVEEDMISVTYESDHNRDLSWNMPSRPGCEFLGWYDSLNDDAVQVYGASGIATNDGTYWRNNVWVHLSACTLYAHWKFLNVAYYKKNGKYVLCNTYYKRSGKWEPALFYMKVNGTYKQSGVSK